MPKYSFSVIYIPLIFFITVSISSANETCQAIDGMHQLSNEEKTEQYVLNNCPEELERFFDTLVDSIFMNKVQLYAQKAKLASLAEDNGYSNVLEVLERYEVSTVDGEYRRSLWEKYPDMMSLLYATSFNDRGYRTFTQKEKDAAQKLMGYLDKDERFKQQFIAATYISGASTIPDLKEMGLEYTETSERIGYKYYHLGDPYVKYAVNPGFKCTEHWQEGYMKCHSSRNFNFNQPFYSTIQSDTLIFINLKLAFIRLDFLSSSATDKRLGKLVGKLENMYGPFKRQDTYKKAGMLDPKQVWINEVGSDVIIVTGHEYVGEYVNYGMVGGNSVEMGRSEARYNSIRFMDPQAWDSLFPLSE